MGNWRQWGDLGKVTVAGETLWVTGTYSPHYLYNMNFTLGLLTYFGSPYIPKNMVIRLFVSLVFGCMGSVGVNCLK